MHDGRLDFLRNRPMHPRNRKRSRRRRFRLQNTRFGIEVGGGSLRDGGNIPNAAEFSPKTGLFSVHTLCLLAFEKGWILSRKPLKTSRSTGRRRRRNAAEAARGPWLDERRRV